MEIGRSTDCMFGVSIASFCRLIMRSSFVIGPHRASPATPFIFSPDPSTHHQPASPLVLRTVAYHAIAIA